MSQEEPVFPPANPFATRFTRPGAIPFLFGPNVNAEQLVGRLREQGWWGQIVGPHGSGKSTLVAALLDPLRSAGRRPELIALHDGQKRLSAEAAPEGWGPATQVIIDGYEQLSRWNRWQLKRHCRRAGCGLLITTHRTQGLPTVYATQGTPETLARIVASLQGAELGDQDRRQLAELLRRHNGNIREALFELYDRHEKSRRGLKQGRI